MARRAGPSPVCHWDFIPWFRHFDFLPCEPEPAALLSSGKVKLFIRPVSLLLYLRIQFRLLLQFNGVLASQVVLWRPRSPAYDCCLAHRAFPSHAFDDFAGTVAAGCSILWLSVLSHFSWPFPGSHAARWCQRSVKRVVIIVGLLNCSFVFHAFGLDRVNQRSYADALVARLSLSSVFCAFRLHCVHQRS